MPAKGKLPALSKAEKRARRRNRKRFKRLQTKIWFVDHPRYGNTPIRSRTPATEAEVRAAYWGYARVTYDNRIIFPETAIPANIWKQKSGWGCRRLYVDIARPCRTCARWFLFFALEQKHWYEELGFFIDADCVECQECRYSRHGQQARIARYEALLANPEKSRKEWTELEQLGQLLFETGYIRKPESLLKTRMPKRLRRHQ
ncbi:MAG: zinc-ribbon domain containing protein [Pseudomonadota bacterium]